MENMTRPGGDGDEKGNVTVDEAKKLAEEATKNAPQTQQDTKTAVEKLRDKLLSKED